MWLGFPICEAFAGRAYIQYLAIIWPEGEGDVWRQMEDNLPFPHLPQTANIAVLTSAFRGMYWNKNSSLSTIKIYSISSPQISDA